MIPDTIYIDNDELEDEMVNTPNNDRSMVLSVNKQRGQNDIEYTRTKQQSDLLMNEEYNNIVNGILYHPKGSMCAVCIHANEKCWFRAFSTMPTLEIYSKGDLGIHVVKCTGFERSK